MASMDMLPDSVIDQIVADATLTPREREVYTLIRDAGETGMTDIEIGKVWKPQAFDAGTSYSSVQGPRGSLRDSGLIRDSGQRRPTGIGRGTATVWVVA